MRFLSSTACVSTLLDLSFSFPFPCCPFAVELRAPDFAFPIINQVSLQSGINNSWLMMQRWMPFLKNSKLFCHKPSSGSFSSIFIGRRHHSVMTAFTPALTRCEDFIGYVDLSDFYEIWLKWSSYIGARKCVRLVRNSKYFYFETSLHVAKRKIFCWSTSKFILSKTNKKILKARHALVAYRLLIDHDDHKASDWFSNLWAAYAIIYISLPLTTTVVRGILLSTDGSHFIEDWVMDWQFKNLLMHFSCVIDEKHI